MNCDNCGSSVPLQKGVTGLGRDIQKGDRTCPDCGDPIGHSPRMLRK